MITSEDNGRRVRIRTRLATAIPGASLRMYGYVRYRTEHRATRTERPALRLAATHSVYLIARDLARASLPGEDPALGERISLAPTDWQKSPLKESPGLQVQARIRLRLSRPDRKRVDEYHTARRMRHGDLAFQSDRLDHFSRRALRDTASARFWWVEHHGISQEAQRAFVPLVGNSGDPRDKSTKIAEIIASAIRDHENKPDDYRNLIMTVDALLRRARQIELADQLDGEQYEPADGVPAPPHSYDIPYNDTSPRAGD
ncbi:hypothetical protein [Nocardiopsis dassonvillei]|uniref:hypothetical protein n=1 Tax=Nocardiopsis dassonvillei TaxID=2014 RepID=UPI003628B09F